MKKLFFIIMAVFLFTGIYAQMTEFPIEKTASQVGHWEIDANGVKTIYTESDEISLTANGTINYLQEDGVWAAEVVNSDNTSATLNYFTLAHNLPPVESTEIKEFCLVMDIKFDLASAYIPLMWNHSYEGDADIFVKRDGSMGLNGGGLLYTSEGFVQVGWNRVIINANLSEEKMTFYTIYPDGTINKSERTVTSTSRFSMRSDSPTDIFRDNGNEHGDTFLSSCALYNTFLSDEELESLGIINFFVDPEEIDFGYAPVRNEPGSYLDINVSATPSIGNEVEFLLNDDDLAEIFLLSDKKINLIDGEGIITVYFYPEEQKEYSSSITIKCGEKEITIPVKGIGAPNVPIEEETWYRIQFSKRTGNCLTDMGTGALIETTPYEAQEEAQLWKIVFVSEDSDGIRNYKMVSKSGNELTYEYPEDEESTGYFSASASSNNTFSFDVRPDGDWQIKWNEYSFDGVNTGYLNKTRNDTYITAYSIIPDDGSAVQFYKENTVVDIGMPEFSTHSGDPIWYYIQFVRVKGKNLNYGILSSEIVYDPEDPETETLSKLGQTTIDKENELLYWKLVGNEDEFLIVDINGNEWGNASRSIVESGTGDYYRLQRYGAKSWALYNLAGASEDGDDPARFVNDFGGSSSAVGEYSLEAGSELVFIPVDRGVSITPPSGIIDGDKITDTYYYTIQGVMLGTKKPSVSGIYIEKNIHESKKVSARKVFIPQK